MGQILDIKLKEAHSPMEWNEDTGCNRTFIILCEESPKILRRNVVIATSVKIHWGFPGGAVVENLPANAGDMGSSPGLGRSHVPRSNWAREPQLLSLRVWSLCPATGGAAIVRGPRTTTKSGPCLPQLEKALA